MLSYGDFIDLVVFSALWIQPLFWMGVHKRSYRDVPLGGLILLASAASILALNLVLASSPVAVNDVFTLFSFYSVLGLLFSGLLVERYGWNFFKALSVGVMTVFAGSFYWEVPYLIRNAFITGPEKAWFWHLVSLIYASWVFRVVGIRRDVGVHLLLFGLGVSVVYILFNPISPGVGGGEVWNTWYYLSNRLICTLIVFLSLDKNKQT